MVLSPGGVRYGIPCGKHVCQCRTPLLVSRIIWYFVFVFVFVFLFVIVRVSTSRLAHVSTIIEILSFLYFVFVFVLVCVFVIIIVISAVSRQVQVARISWRRQDADIGGLFSLQSICIYSTANSFKIKL